MLIIIASKGSPPALLQAGTHLRVPQLSPEALGHVGQDERLGPCCAGRSLRLLHLQCDGVRPRVVVAGGPTRARGCPPGSTPGYSHRAGMPAKRARHHVRVIRGQLPLITLQPVRGLMRDHVWVYVVCGGGEDFGEH